MQRKTTEEVQKELSEKFINLVIIEEYTDANKKILVKCNDCGHEWKVIPRSLIKSKCGCVNCGVSITRKNKAKEAFIKKLDSSFELIEYTSPTSVKVKCKKCGFIRDTTSNNIHRFGCKRCSSIKINEDRKFTNEIFIEKAKNIHGNFYDYSNVEYINFNTKVSIICPKHGEFWQSPAKHLFGQNCPKCKESGGESIIRTILEENNITYVQEKIIKLYKAIKVDFYVEILNKIYIIEMNGLQHYKAIEFFGGEEKFIEQSKRDLALKNYCEENNIFLYIIKYNESISDKMLNFINVIVPSTKGI